MENKLTDAVPVPPFWQRNRVKAADFFINVDFSVIYEDEDILLVEKPAPLAVHPVGSYFELNLHTLMKKDPRWLDSKIHFTHRLDAETSGLILVAKNYESARFLGIEFMNSRVKKTYEALVFGTPKEAKGEINLPLGRDLSSGFQTVRIADFETGEAASTRYELIETLGEYSRLKLEPLTGRTHQLRAHLALIGHPIVGDKIYIDLNIFRRYVIEGMDAAMIARIKLRRQALHATSLQFTHPRTKEIVMFHSPSPKFIEDVLKVAA